MNNEEICRCSKCNEEIPKYISICPHCGNKGPLIADLSIEGPLEIILSGTDRVEREPFIQTIRQYVKGPLELRAFKSRFPPAKGKDVPEGFLSFWDDGLIFICKKAHKASEFGLEMAARAARKIIPFGGTIVYGLAYGISKAAEKLKKEKTIEQFMKLVSHPNSFALPYIEMKNLEIGEFEESGVFRTVKKGYVEICAFSNEKYYILFGDIETAATLAYTIARLRCFMLRRIIDKVYFKDHGLDIDKIVEEVMDDLRKEHPDAKPEDLVETFRQRIKAKIKEEMERKCIREPGEDFYLNNLKEPIDTAEKFRKFLLKIKETKK
jgi:hypothetical protein